MRVPLSELALVGIESIASEALHTVLDLLPPFLTVALLAPPVIAPAVALDQIDDIYRHAVAPPAVQLGVGREQPADCAPTTYVRFSSFHRRALKSPTLSMQTICMWPFLLGGEWADPKFTGDLGRSRDRLRETRGNNLVFGGQHPEEIRVVPVCIILNPGVPFPMTARPCTVKHGPTMEGFIAQPASRSIFFPGSGWARGCPTTTKRTAAWTTISSRIARPSTSSPGYAAPPAVLVLNPSKLDVSIFNPQDALLWVHLDALLNGS